MTRLSLSTPASRVNTMSVTTTANPVSGAVLQVLTDYDLHHSGEPARPKTPEGPDRRTKSLRLDAEPPEDWDNAHRRVPVYRPVDSSLRGPERPDGVNAIEKTFIFVMLNGVGLMAVCLPCFAASGDTADMKQEH